MMIGSSGSITIGHGCTTSTGGPGGSSHGGTIPGLLGSLGKPVGVAGEREPVIGSTTPRLIASTASASAFVLS